MQNYSILFLDIDGTILDGENRVSASLKQLFRKLGNEGIPVILNSSRSPGGMLEFRKETGMQNPYVSYGGSLILDGNDRILSETGIPLERAVRLFRFIRGLKADISVSFYVYDVWMTDCISHPAVCREAEITGCSPVECDFENLSGSVNCVHKILCIGEHEELERIAEGKTRGFSDMVFSFSKDDTYCLETFWISEEHPNGEKYINPELEFSHFEDSNEYQFSFPYGAMMKCYTIELSESGDVMEVEGKTLTKEL